MTDLHLEQLKHTVCGIGLCRSQLTGNGPETAAQWQRAGLVTLMLTTRCISIE
jgi:hypothetical protein